MFQGYFLHTGRSRKKKSSFATKNINILYFICWYNYQEIIFQRHNKKYNVNKKIKCGYSIHQGSAAAVLLSCRYRKLPNALISNCKTDNLQPQPPKKITEYRHSIYFPNSSSSRLKWCYYSRHSKLPLYSINRSRNMSTTKKCTIAEPWYNLNTLDLFLHSECVCLRKGLKKEGKYVWWGLTIPN